MIIGVGTDLVHISRVEKTLSKLSMRFAKRILTPNELVIFHTSTSPASYLAKRFAAKEAASKSLGTGIGKISWQDMEVVNNVSGAPCLVLSGAALQRMQELGGQAIHLSLSDEQDLALAFVIVSS